MSSPRPSRTDGPLRDRSRTRPRTNLVVFRPPHADGLLAHLQANGVLGGTLAPGVVRLVTHLDLDDDGILIAQKAIAPPPDGCLWFPRRIGVVRPPRAKRTSRGYSGRSSWRSARIWRHSPMARRTSTAITAVPTAARTAPTTRRSLRPCARPCTGGRRSRSRSSRRTAADEVSRTNARTRHRDGSAEGRRSPRRLRRIRAEGVGSAAVRTLVVLPTTTKRTTSSRCCARPVRRCPAGRSSSSTTAAPTAPPTWPRLRAATRAASSVLRRAGEERARLGLPRRVRAGASSAGYDVLVEMDSDLSARPGDAPGAARRGRRRRRPGHRVALRARAGRSRTGRGTAGCCRSGATATPALVLGMQVRDATAGFRAYRADVLSQASTSTRSRPTATASRSRWPTRSPQRAAASSRCRSRSTTACAARRRCRAASSSRRSVS